MNARAVGLIRDGAGVSARALLGVVFLWACFHKIADPHDFGLQVATYQILPLALNNLWAIILPWLEAVAAALLIAGFWTRAAALVTCAMNLIFIAAIALALQADLQLQCGCFASSSAGEQMTVGLIWRDLGLLAAGLFLVVQRPDRLTVDDRLERGARHGA